MVNLPSDLYELAVDPIEVPLGLPVVAGLTGFTDAGGTVAQVADSLFANYDYTLVAEFSNDELLDYRSRRPVMFFERDHIISYEPQQLGLYLMQDEAGNPFLFLHGYEPDFKWESFVEALEDLFSLFAISSFTWVHSIPFPIPHTKPIGVTVSGTRRELIDAISEWKPSTSVPGNVLHLIEYRLGNDGVPMAGFVFLVPHYLADNEYPEAAISAFQQISAATALVFKTDPLREENTRFRKRLETQITENPELQRMVAQLEQGYQTGESNPMRAPMQRPAQRVPSADEIAAELEDYLASKLRNDGEPPLDADSGSNGA
jgi:hypothetical protein